MSRSFRRPAATLAALLMIASTTAAIAQPLIYGHRGASAYRPEHTLAAYELAIDQGADYVEPDLVSTRDGVLVARHENFINETTDVASRPEFASRRTTKSIDGVSYTGWFTEDFDLAELKTLRAVERIPGNRPGNVQYNGQFEVPTLQEVIDLVQQKEAQLGRPIGIIPETKHPSYFDGINLSLEEPLIRVLTENGYNSAADRVIIQSFEVANLKELSQVTDIRLVQLTTTAGGRPYDFVLAGDTRTYGSLLTADGLAEIASYADILGPDKSLIIPRDANGNLLAPTGLVALAKAAGLEVVPYTFRPENPFLPANLRNGTGISTYGNDRAEFLAFFNAGIDGLFADAPDRAVAARDAFVASIPEPATWASMIAGFGLVGGAIRRRRRTTPTALA